MGEVTGLSDVFTNEVSAIRDEIKRYGDKFNYDTGTDTANLINFYSKGNGAAEFSAMTTEEREERIRSEIDRRRYDELEIAEDIKAAFPQDADKDLATLKADYPSLFALADDAPTLSLIHIWRCRRRG